jgi:3-keto-L-gulonate-6-phosphate decarboxylase
MNNIKNIKKANFDIAIIGGAITKSDNIMETAKKFKLLMEEV